MGDVRWKLLSRGPKCSFKGAGSGGCSAGGSLNRAGGMERCNEAVAKTPRSFMDAITKMYIYVIAMSTEDPFEIKSSVGRKCTIDSRTNEHLVRTLQFETPRTGTYVTSQRWRCM